MVMVVSTLELEPHIYVGAMYGQLSQNEELTILTAELHV
jgi:hypothetical protein